ncbi:Aminoacylase-1 [Smittium culicis]|uniref:N-acyl-aliphatic-L-amino acid amidohydrolase n=1 Tax=Smittium culicis TaxID=133412 RepID=A0A1R1Y382_9FUNG|nr:Aminoacylase-1 [Smittium culicis]
MQPKPDYGKCAEFLIDQAKEIGLEHSIVECVEGKPFVIMKLEGSDPSAKSILLSSHTDVVPVFEERWSHPPFAAERVEMENGDYKIYARGAQDMKNTGSMYLEAMRNIKASGKKLKRNVYIIFSPDEEIGSVDGVNKFVETQEFNDMNVGFDLDEGGGLPAPFSAVFYAERTNCQLKFTAHGNTGHGSQFIEGTAIEKLLPVINAMMERRAKEKAVMDSFEAASRLLRSGEVTSINLTQLEGGKQPNVVPATYSVTFDIRVSPNIDLAEFKKFVSDLAAENGVEVEYSRPHETTSKTPLDRSNIFIDTFFKSLDQQNFAYKPVVLPANTDARFIRQKNIPAFGFNPMQNTPILAHDHDEFIFESEYIKGIPVYTQLIQDLANC